MTTKNYTDWKKLTSDELGNWIARSKYTKNLKQRSDEEIVAILDDLNASYTKAPCTSCSLGRPPPPSFKEVFGGINGPLRALSVHMEVAIREGKKKYNFNGKNINIPSLKTPSSNFFLSPHFSPSNAEPDVGRRTFPTPHPLALTRQTGVARPRSSRTNTTRGPPPSWNSLPIMQMSSLPPLPPKPSNGKGVRSRRTKKNKWGIKKFRNNRNTTHKRNRRNSYRKRRR